MKKVDFSNYKENPETEEERIEKEIKKLAFSKDPNKYDRIEELLEESFEKKYITEKQYTKHLNNLNVARDGLKEIKRRGKIILDRLGKKIKNKMKKSDKNDK